MKKMPILFTGHGSPMNLVDDNDYTRTLKKLAETLPRPRAICVISSHWQTRGIRICCDAFPRQVYDFYDFPSELYDIVYEPVGSPDDAVRALELMDSEENNVFCSTAAMGDPEWGNDHSAWAVLIHLFPRADIPTFYVSVDNSMPAEQHVALAKKLQALREEGVMIIGSGNVVHNLHDLDWRNRDAAPSEPGYLFDQYVKEALQNNDLERLVQYRQSGEMARYSAPTEDHFLPLLWIAALKDENDTLQFIYEGFQNRSVSMTSFMYS